MGAARPEQPWRLARAILRAGLGPAVLTVVGGELRVGFRGPAAAAFGDLAAALVPGGLRPMPWEQVALPIGPFVACDIEDSRVAAITPHGAWRLRDG